MDIAAAESLVEHINHTSSRFRAGVLKFADRGWVIIEDRQTNSFLEPIVNPEDYLNRVCEGKLRIDTTCQDLIRDWVTRE